MLDQTMVAWFQRWLIRMRRDATIPVTVDDGTTFEDPAEEAEGSN